MRGSLPPLFVFAEMDNKPHTQHFAIKFDVTAKVSTVRGSEPEVFFFLSSFCLNHAFSLKFNYQSSNFLFLYARSTFLAPSKQSATHTERKQNPQTQLTVRSHRSPQHLCTLRRLRTCSCRPHPTSNTAGTTQLRSFRPSFLPSVCPARPVMWQQRGVTSWQRGAGRSWVSVWIKGQICAAERQTGHVPVPEVRHMTRRLRQIKSLVSVECSLVSWPRSASLRVNGSDGCGGGDAEVCCKGAQKILKKINK